MLGSQRCTRSWQTRIEIRHSSRSWWLAAWFIIDFDLICRSWSCCSSRSSSLTGRPCCLSIICIFIQLLNSASPCRIEHFLWFVYFDQFIAIQCVQFQVGLAIGLNGLFRCFEKSLLLDLLWLVEVLGEASEHGLVSAAFIVLGFQISALLRYSSRLWRLAQIVLVALVQSQKLIL